MYVDQATNKTRLSVCDLDRLVGAHDQEGVESRVVRFHVLLVDLHDLVRHDRVEDGVVFDPRQVAIVLDCQKWVGGERSRGELIGARSQSFSVERGVITHEQLRQDVDDGALALAGRTIEHQELLIVFRVPRYNGPNSPLDLGTLIRLVERADYLVPSTVIARSKVVRKSL